MIVTQANILLVQVYPTRQDMITQRGLSESCRHRSECGAAGLLVHIEKESISMWMKWVQQMKTGSFTM